MRPEDGAGRGEFADEGITPATTRNLKVVRGGVEVCTALETAGEDQVPGGVEGEGAPWS